jgi:signal transduction histidine kinase
VFALSIRSKILLGFVVMLLSFGGSSLYGAWAVRTLGQQLRLVALGYSALRLELQDQQTLQANLQKRLAEPEPSPRFFAAVAADRKLRRARLQGARQRVKDLRRSLPPADAAFLAQIEQALEALDKLYVTADGLAAQAGPATGRQSERQTDEQATQLLSDMSSRLTNKVVEVVSAGQRYEARAVWMTVLLFLAAAVTGTIVLLLVQATLRPLRRLADSAKEVARGNYRVWRDRVPASTRDEVGDLAREFNAMAAALEERELRLRRSEQLAAVGKMAAQITHEVRNPLTAIGLNAELLADEFAGKDSEGQQLAQAIVKEVDRLTNITEQYLRFARLPQPRFEPADLNDLLRSLLQFAGEELRARGVAVEVSLDPALPQVRIDDNQVRQALLNLIRNASEAMADAPIDQRHLIVRSRCAAYVPLASLPPTASSSDPRPEVAGIAVDVIDSGPGIPAEQQRQIFEPFFTTKRGGTGLGLALAQEVVTRHGGQLVVDSPVSGSPPAGTRFTLEIPVR